MPQHRHVVVDNSQLEITYPSGGWEGHSDVGIPENVRGWSGIRGTWHELHGTGVATLLFNGTEVWLAGAPPEPTNGGSGTLNLQYTCFLDGKPLEIFNLTRLDMPESYGRLCSAADLTDEVHNFTVAANLVREPAETFLVLDAIFYAPVATKVDVQDPEGSPLFVQYGVGDLAVSLSKGDWDTTEMLIRGDLIYTTRVKGATINITFTGSSISLLGWRAFGTRFDPTKASYILDDGPSISFEVPTISQPYHQRHPPWTFFETAPTPRQKHTLVVTYEGIEPDAINPAPFSFDYFLVRDGDIDPEAPPGKFPSTPLTVKSGQPAATPDGRSPDEEGEEAGARVNGSRSATIGGSVAGTISVVLLIITACGSST